MNVSAHTSFQCGLSPPPIRKWNLRAWIVEAHLSQLKAGAQVSPGEPSSKNYPQNHDKKTNRGYIKPLCFGGSSVCGNR